MSDDNESLPSDSSLRDLVRSAGLRATKSRIAVLRVLGRDGVPRTHGEVSDVLASEAWDRATLYRNLTDLTSAGLLRRLDLGDRVWRYELSEGSPDIESDRHPHFLCTSCGDVQCLPDASMAISGDVPRSVASGAVAVQVRGLCDTCVQV